MICEIFRTFKLYVESLCEFEGSQEVRSYPGDETDRSVAPGVPPKLIIAEKHHARLSKMRECRLDGHPYLGACIVVEYLYSGWTLVS